MGGGRSRIIPVVLVFTGCRAEATGGAVHGEYFSVRLIDCRFGGNRAGHGVVVDGLLVGW